MVVFTVLLVALGITLQASIWNSKSVYSGNVKVLSNEFLKDTLNDHTDTLSFVSPIINIKFPAETTHYYLSGPLNTNISVIFLPITLDNRELAGDTILTKSGTELGKSGFVEMSSIDPEVFRGRFQFVIAASDTFDASGKMQFWYIYQEGK